jgi:alanine-glyoxylate transaminase/(R)-3-amino-2-methylpropionate-pyruvate transaminase
MSIVTMGLNSLSTWKFPIPHGQDVKHAICPDRYRGPYGYDDPKAATKYAWDVKNVIQHCTTGQVAGFICEPIQGVGGVIDMPKGYLDNVYKYVREAGGLCISDEVQTGFGRTGKAWWGFEMLGVKPDIVTMAKGIGNGWPLACVVTTPEISKNLTKKLHFNTYGGNPIVMAVGSAVIDIIEEEKLIENTATIGNILIKGLKDLQKKYSFIGDIRGEGLMLGVDIVSNPETKEPSVQLAVKILEQTKDRGVLIGKGGYSGNVLRIKPVLCMNKEDAEFALSVFEDVFSNLK